MPVAILLSNILKENIQPTKIPCVPYKPKTRKSSKLKFWSNNKTNNYGNVVFPILAKLMPHVWRNSKIDPDLENNNRGLIGWYIDGMESFIIKGNLNPQKYKYAIPTYSLQEIQKMRAKSRRKDSKKWWILKPSHRYVGSGMYITVSTDLNDILDDRNRPTWHVTHYIDPDKDWIVQPLLTNLKLWSFHKFDCRFYAIIFRNQDGAIDFRTYNYGFARLAIDEFDENNLTSMITNISVQEKLKGYSYLDHTQLIYDDIGVVHNIMSDLMINTEFTLDNRKLAQIVILGMDIIFDSYGNPYLIEVNHSPAMEANTPNADIEKYCFEYLVYGIYGGIIPALLENNNIPSMSCWR